jgi:TRAP-type uncharacterized transport system fused permease subunit
MIGDWPSIFWATATAAIGVIVFAAGLHGYFVTASAYWQSAVLVIGGFFLIDPNGYTDILGAAMVVFVFATQYLSRAKAGVPAE